MHDIILIFSVIGGLAATVLGPLLAIAYAAVGLLGRGAGREPATASVALGVAVISVGLGVPLVWVGGRAMQHAPGHSFRLPGWWAWLVALLFVLALGQAAILTPLAALLMPLFQVAAGVIPALLFLSLAVGAAAQGRAAVARRAAVGSLAWGGLGGTGVALIIELALMLFGLIAVAVWLQMANPALIQRLQALVQQMQRTGHPPDLTQFADLATSPAVAVAVLAFVGVLGPVIEEFLKGLAVPIVAATGRRLSRLDGLLLGVAAGAGFAIVEGVLNGSLALGMAGMWAGLMVFRGAAAGMHCMASGLTGLGWHAILVDRRWARGLGLGLLAVLMHGTWNMGAGLIGLSSLRSAEPGGSAAMARLGVTGLLVLGMAVVWVIAVTGLALIPRELANRTEDWLEVGEAE